MADMLATKEELAIFLDRTDVPIATATLLLEAATAAVQAVTGQRIVQVLNDAITIELEPGDYSTWLDLPELPVTAVHSVTIGGNAILDHTPMLSRGRLWRSTGWRQALTYNSPASVDVVVDHGYASTDQRIQLAKGTALSLAAGLLDNPTGASREQIGDYSIAYERASAQLTGSREVCALLRRRYGRPPRSVKLITAGGY